MLDQPNLIPLFDRCFIRFDIDPDADVGMIAGIHTPQGFKRPAEGAGFPYYTAKILSIGPDVRQLKEGMSIAIARDRVEKFSIGIHTYWQINEKSVAGILP